MLKAADLQPQAESAVRGRQGSGKLERVSSRGHPHGAARSAPRVSLCLVFALLRVSTWEAYRFRPYADKLCPFNQKVDGAPGYVRASLGRSCND